MTISPIRILVIGALADMAMTSITPLFSMLSTDTTVSSLQIPTFRPKNVRCKNQVLMLPPETEKINLSSDLTNIRSSCHHV
jgi:hypothetical protein